MTITDEMVERATEALCELGEHLHGFCCRDWGQEANCNCRKLARAALEAALSGEPPDWKKPLYEDGKTPDKRAIDEAADEYRRNTLREALSGPQWEGG